MAGSGEVGCHEDSDIARLLAALVWVTGCKDPLAAHRLVACCPGVDVRTLLQPIAGLLAALVSGCNGTMLQPIAGLLAALVWV